MGKVLISGATGWLGRETIRKVVGGSFKEIDSSNLILQSSKNRVVDFGKGYKFLVQEFNGHLEAQEIMGFVHLAFLTREKVAEYGFENYAIRNLQLISSACQVIRRMKPKWVVLVSSGAIAAGLAPLGLSARPKDLATQQATEAAELRNEKEFVNHKILDLAGDFLLSGFRVLGKVKCYQGGHELTNMFLRKLLQSQSVSTSVELEDIELSKKINYKYFNFMTMIFIL